MYRAGRLLGKNSVKRGAKEQVVGKKSLFNRCCWVFGPWCGSHQYSVSTRKIINAKTVGMTIIKIPRKGKGLLSDKLNYFSEKYSPVWGRKGISQYIFGRLLPRRISVARKFPASRLMPSKTGARY